MLRRQIRAELDVGELPLLRVLRISSRVTRHRYKITQQNGSLPEIGLVAVELRVEITPSTRRLLDGVAVRAFNEPDLTANLSQNSKSFLQSARAFLITNFIIASALSIAPLASANAISGSIIQNSARWRAVCEFSARNVGPKV